MLEFAPQLPADLGAYVRFLSHEDAETIGADAALNLTWRQLGDRLLRWEDFARSHPQLKEIDSEVKPHILNLADLFLFGTDNTQTYDQESLIKPDLIAAWRDS